MLARLLMFLYLVACPTVLSQEYTARAGYDYTMFYNHNTASVYRHRSNAAFDAGNLKYGFDVNSYNIDYTSGSFVMPQGLENILSLQGSVEYTKAIGPTWDFSVYFAPRLSWATNQYATFKNIIPEGGISITKKFEGKSEAYLQFGAAYSTLFGEPSIIPLLSYGATYDKLSIIAGIPETVVSYSLNEKHSFSASINTSSLYSRLPGYNYYTDNSNTEYKIKALEWVNISAALGYRFTSGPDWDASFLVGKTLYNTFKMSGHDNQSLNIGFSKNLWVSLGFIYKLNFKK